MKRSGQVALVLMGVTATTAAGAYLMPQRSACQPRTTLSPAVAPAPGAASQPEAPAAMPECRRRGWGGWRWGSGSYYDRSTRSSPVTPSTALRSTSPSRTTSSSPSASRTTTSTSRSGFGSTGRSISRSSGS